MNTVFACDCALISTEDAVNKSGMVFSGKVVGFEYRKGIPNEFMTTQGKEDASQTDYETLVVKIQVEQWWKGDVPAEVVLLTSTTKNADGTMSVSSCDYHFRQGESYLIFAVGKEDAYRTSDCLRTKKLAQAEEELKILGEGKEPVEKKDEPDRP
ncbi:MAG TPA: hypothetical protein VGV59_17325 [Pyrinomonadaceae bacterium]|nr:hypothetical protein [Pyrinomonadaceae bacterium]